MATERFSMKEWRPEPLYDKIQRLELAMNAIEEEKLPLKNRKRDIEVELNDYNIKLKGMAWEEKAHNDLNSKRGQLVKEKGNIERLLSDIKTRLSKLNTERESVKMELKRKPNEAIQQSLLELRDKYLSFAADTTRVSSMRAMSSKFVEEIQSILKHLI